MKAISISPELAVFIANKERRFFWMIRMRGINRRKDATAALGPVRRETKAALYT
jgi:hypothetical protein